MSVHSGRLRRRAFTLVELIVVITVLAILSVILIPVVAKVRDSAQSTHCVSNMQQIGRAFTLYAEEHRGLLPAPADPMSQTFWFEAIHAYTGKSWDPSLSVDGQLAAVFNCPTLTLSDHTPTRTDIGYSMSAALGSTQLPDPTRPIALTSLQQPTRTVVVLEADGTEMPFFPVDADLAAFSTAYTTTGMPKGCDRHGGAANYLFADGHVGHHTPSEAAGFLTK